MEIKNNTRDKEKLSLGGGITVLGNMGDGG